DAVAGVRPLFEHAADTARDDKQPLAKRIAACRLLGFGPLTVASGPLEELLTPHNPSELQLAAVRALALHDDPKVAGMLLEPWTAYSPRLRREVLEALFAQPGRVAALLTASQESRVLPTQIEPARLEQLRRYPDAGLRQRAQELLASQVTADRRKV